MRLGWLAILGACGLFDGAGDKPGLLEDKDGDDDGYPYGEDCNDDNDDINPGAPEVCDPADVDEDCNGLADNADDDPGGSLYAYHDADGDGYGDPDDALDLCEVMDGFVTDATDCDDDDASANPGAVEVCDPLDVDEDCDNAADDADPGVQESTQSTWYEDADGDGYGADDASVIACDGHGLYVEEGGDCDDADASIHPGATESWYDEVDSDCSGGSDLDRDGDGYDAESDCDDGSAAAHPGAEEDWYDGVDADCSGGSDYDQDGDGWDSDGYGGDDCDDEDPDTHPGASEDGTGGDANCDGDAVPTPEADASYDRTSSALETCTTVYLDGSGSSDPRDSALTYEWQLANVPSGALESTDDIVEPDDESPAFVPATSGDYTFELVVTSELGVASWPDTLTLDIAERTSNEAPDAEAGPGQEAEETVACVDEGYTVTCQDCDSASFSLDASATSDADDEPLSYAWSISYGTADLSSETDVLTTVTLPAVSPTYGSATETVVIVQLDVTDCYGDTTSDSVQLTATCTGE